MSCPQNSPLFPYTTLFRSPLGFVKRVGIREAKQEMKYRWRPGGSAILNYGPLVKIVYTWDPSGLLLDRKSTRLNSSHTVTSYAVFCSKTTTISAPSRSACR